MAPPLNSPSFSDIIGTDTGITPTIVSDGTTRDNTLSFSGTTDAGTQVDVYRAGAGYLGTATVTGTTWTYTTPVLMDGSLSFSVIATDAAGHAARSNAVNANIFTEAPYLSGHVRMDDGVMLRLSSGDVLSGNPTLVLGGEVGVNSPVRIYDGTIYLGQAVVDGGTWTFHAPALAEGAHSFSAQVTDAYGNTGISTSFGAVIDTQGPSLTVNPVFATNGDSQPNVASGGITRDNTLTLTGTVEAGATVKVYDGDTSLGLATVSGTQWILNTPALPDGRHEFSVRAYDSVRNATNAPAGNVTVDTRISVTMSPTILTNAGPEEQLVSGATTRDNTPLLAGTVEANASVDIYDHGSLLGRASVNGTSWTFTTPALADGGHNFTAVATDAAGNRLETASTYLYTDATVALASIDPSMVTDTGKTATIAGGQVTRDPSLGLEGSAEAGSVVEILSNDVSIGYADLVGTRWTFTTPMLEDGSRSLKARIIDRFGNVALTNSLTANIKSHLEASLNAELATDSGSTATVHDAATRDTTLGLSGFAEAGARITVHEMANGLDRVLGEVARAPGTTAWTFETVPLAQGWHGLYVVFEDAAGNQVRSQTVSALVDTTAPLATLDQSMWVQSNTGALVSVNANSATPDSTLLIHGNAEAGARVEIFDDQAALGAITVADSRGFWQFTTPALAIGQHAIYAKVSDAAGNVTVTGTIRPTVASLAGGAGAEKIVGTNAVDVIAGCGGADTLAGGGGDDMIVVPDWNFAKVDGGKGADTLQLSGAKLPGDLRLMTNKINNIETIDLRGSGANSLILDMRSASLLPSEGVHTLTILGNADDSVQFLMNRVEYAGIKYVADSRSDTEAPGFHSYHYHVDLVGIGRTDLTLMVSAEVGRMIVTG